MNALNLIIVLFLIGAIIGIERYIVKRRMNKNFVNDSSLRKDRDLYEINSLHFDEYSNPYIYIGSGIRQTDIGALYNRDIISNKKEAL